MEITLNNFGCHTSRTFTFNDSKMTLVCGDNGKGKSTLLNAIVFAFFGVSSEIPCTYGKKKCWVVLKYMVDADMDGEDVRSTIVVKRSYGPARLQVWVIPKCESAAQTDMKVLEATSCFEGQEAQEIIDRYIGTYDEFMSSSFSQIDEESILRMTPANMLDYIRKIRSLRVSMSSDSETENSEYHKKLIKEKLKEISSNITSLKMGISVLESQLNTQDTQNTNTGVEEDIPAMLSELEKDISELTEQSETLTTELKEYEKTYEKVSGDIESYNVLSQDKNRLEIEISQLRQQQGNLGHIPSEEDISSLDKQLLEQKSLLAQSEAYRQYGITLQKAKKSKEDYIQRLKDEIDELQKNTISEEEYNKYKLQVSPESLEASKQKSLEYARQKALYDQGLQIRDEAIEITDTIRGSKQTILADFGYDELVMSIEGLIRQNKEKFVDPTDKPCGIYECPACDQILTLVGDELECITYHTDKFDEHGNVIVKDDEDDTVHRKNVDILEKLLEKVQGAKDLMNVFVSSAPPDDYSNIKMCIDHVQKYEKQKSSIQDINKKITNPSNENLPKEIQDIFTSAEGYRLKFSKGFNPKTLMNTQTIKEAIEKISSEIERISKMISSCYETRSQNSSLSREISRKENELKMIIRRMPANNCRRNPGDAENIQAQIITLRGQLASNLQAIQEKKSALQNYQYASYILSLEKDLQNKKAELDTFSTEYEGYVGLEKARAEAELLSITEVIDAINYTANEHLKRLFDVPVTVKIRNQDPESGKIKLSLYIQFKSTIRKHFRSLSSGEKQRCCLAFYLAINELLGSKILILDECLDKQDSAANVQLLEYLHNNTKDKMTICVSHKTISGIFDDILQL